MSNPIKDLKKFHDHFGFPRNSTPDFLSEDYMQMRLNFIIEEFNELEDSYESRSLIGTIDALIDLSYVALGTLDLMGVDTKAHWDEVHKCNMAKERVTGASDSKRNFHFDVKKPDGWKGPDHDRILEDTECQS